SPADARAGRGSAVVSSILEALRELEASKAPAAPGTGAWTEERSRSRSALETIGIVAGGLAVRAAVFALVIWLAGSAFQDPAAPQRDPASRRNPRDAARGAVHARRRGAADPPGLGLRPARRGRRRARARTLRDQSRRAPGIRPGPLTRAASRTRAAPGRPSAGGRRSGDGRSPAHGRGAPAGRRGPSGCHSRRRRRSDARGRPGA